MFQIEHNGFSHAAVSFIATVLALPTQNARVYFPADANTATSIIAHLSSIKEFGQFDCRN